MKLTCKLQSFPYSVAHFIQKCNRDRVTVYAAQASFFVIISTMPLLSLMISAVSLLIPTDVQSIINSYEFSDELLVIIGSLLEDLQSAPKVSLLSLPAMATLWSASRGFNAIQTGLETVYDSEAAHGFFFHVFKSILTTIAFIVLILLCVVLMLFGDYIGERLKLMKVTDLILRWRTPFILVFLCIAFTAIYASAAKRSHSVKSTILYHLPGAILASCGWVLFSKVYSMYIKFFPRASYIYGSLAAICLMMLWFYFCMIILLLGAEVNHLIIQEKQHEI